MKRLCFLLILVILATSLFANGSREDYKITVLHSGESPLPSGDMTFTRAAEMTKKDFPGLSVELQVIDLSTGAPITMDTMIASGNPPDVYADSMVRLSRYIIPEFALPLDGLVDPVYLYTDPLKRGGKLLALPLNGAAQGMALNLDLLEAAGYEVKDDWTDKDFLEMCRKVKEYSDKTGKEVYGTGLFAGNQSGDYLWMQWFAVFGVDLYDDDYAESTQINGGEKVWAFLKLLKDKGYVPGNSATLTDDDYALMWSKGMFAATAFYSGWTDGYFKSAIEQGLIKKPHRMKFVPFPNNAPLCTNWSGLVVNKDSKYPKEAATYLKYATDAYIQQVQVKYGYSIAYRSDISAASDSEQLNQIVGVVAKNGLYDLGVTNSWFAEVRGQGFPVLQAVLSGKISPKEAAKLYTQKVNEIIK
ncbi:MAG: extracellular solute-binding protein [Phycisphaerae bacterium]|nr:extracellular solute-binding protein [Phycisphaerae bacterium]